MVPEPVSIGREATNSDTGPVYQLEHVTKRFGRGVTAVDAIRSINLQIASGEFVAIVGPSGSGKTTLLQILGALDRPTSGHVICRGQNFATMSERDLARLRRDTIGFIFQQFNLIPTLTAQANVEVALAPTVRGRDRQNRARALLEAVVLGARAGHLPSQLSGGEQQRVAIARALANRPAVLLADEPTGNLDSTTGKEIIGLLRSFSERQGQTIIVITHDHAIATMAPRVVALRDGKIVSGD